MMNIRWIGVKIIEEVYEQEHFLGEVLDGYFHVHDFETHEKAFLNKLVYGTVESQMKIDYIINQFSKTKVTKLKPFVYYVLSISIYQLLEMQNVPPSAVCNEAVKLIKKRKMNQLAGYVNGVLRTISREIQFIIYPDKKTEFKNYIQVYYSMPLWLVELLLSQYDETVVEQIAIDSNLVPKLSVRLNTNLSTPEEFERGINTLGLQLSDGYILPYAYRIEGAVNLNKMDLFQKGYFTVQDESSMLVAEVMEIASGDVVLDLCSAPGGKTTHLASFVGPNGRIDARDISQRKLELVKENAKRLQLDQISYKVHDATVLDPTIEAQYNYVLADVPCSGLGIIKKKPDIKRFMNPDKIRGLLDIQKNILKVSASYVKIGGTLIYSTCTINKQENQDQINGFLKEHPDFVLESFSLPTMTPNMILETGMIQLLPVEQITDGFFIAKLKKVNHD